MGSILWLAFNIPVDSTVIWRAYQTSNTGVANVTVIGGGTFEIHSGLIHNGNTANQGIDINGATVRVLGGVVSSSGSMAITGFDGNLIIEGGTVSATGAVNGVIATTNVSAAT